MATRCLKSRDALYYIETSNKGLKMNYNDFIESKVVSVGYSGFELKKDQLNSMLFDWQKDVVSLVVEKRTLCYFRSLRNGQDAYAA